MDQILRNTSAELSNTFYVNGVATDADGNVTVVATKANGTELANTLALSGVAGDGKYAWPLPPQAPLSILTLDWSGVFSGSQITVTTHAEIVGGFMFTLAEARQFRNDKIATGSTLGDRVSDEEILEARDEVTQFFERTTGVSFVPRYRREIHDGRNKSAIYLDRREVQTIQSITENGIALTEGVDFYAYPSGRLVREGSVWSGEAPRNIVVDYEHGYEITPLTIKRSALIVLHSMVVGSDLHDRKIFQQDESGIFRLSFPDSPNDRPTGIPYVDARLMEYATPWGVS